jgi:hypothetical protein
MQLKLDDATSLQKDTTEKSQNKVLSYVNEIKRKEEEIRNLKEFLTEREEEI